ncbi:MAG: hypothetical protein EXS31_10635 [Pedosphaera sp.]|nr:hypothetical protein [Pedosphaera sp.]
MKKLIVCLTVTAITALSLQAGESTKATAACCDSKAKTTSTSSCSSKAGAKTVKKAPMTAKGGQLAMR